MKYDLYVMGVYRGQREISDASLVGLLASGRFAEATGKAQEMRADLDAIVAKREEKQEGSDG